MPIQEMTKMKKIVLILSGLAAGVVFAVEQPEVQVVSFSSQGTDYYADGKTSVLDGECYALVWSEDGVFEGIAGDGSPKDSNDKVVYVGAFAKDGKCKYVEFHIANDYAKTGKFDVWVLDTRVFKDGEVVSWGKKGKMIVTAAAKANEASVEVASGAAAPSGMAGISGGARATEGSVDLDKIEPPVISGLSFDRDGEGNKLAVISFEKTVQGARYSILGAKSPTMKDAQEGAVTTGTGEPMSVIAPKFGNFYRAVVK